MWFLVEALAWPWLASAALIGAGVGWLSSGRADAASGIGWLGGAAAALGVALLLTVLGVVPGRTGLWLDIGVMLTGAYLLGAVAGCLARAILAPGAMELTPAAASGPAIAPAAPAPPTASPPTASRTGLFTPNPDPPPRESSAQADMHAKSAPPSVVPPDDGRPRGLEAPRGGQADDLKIIRGIGPRNEKRLHELGIFHFDQIAAWTRREIDWVAGYLAFPGRIDRERWVEQARELMARDAKPL